MCRLPRWAHGFRKHGDSENTELTASPLPALARSIATPLGSERTVLSVVCAVYNAQAFVQTFLDSYAAQRRPDVELIVVDGASTDSTLQLVESSGVADRVMSGRDRGIYDAWNKALPFCRGTHVAFIGADDIIAESALDFLVNACLQDSEAQQLIAGFNVLTKGRIPVALLGEPWNPAILGWRLPMAQVLSAHPLAWIRAVGNFDANYKSAGDYELILRGRDSIIVRVIPKVLAYMEDGGISRKPWLPHLECFRARRANGYGLTFCLVVLCKAAAGVVLRSLGLRK